MQTMVYSQMYPGDVNFLDSVETYLRKTGLPTGLTPQERLIVTEQARNTLYSFDVQCIPRIAYKILDADMDTDQEARALWIAFYNHVLDPIFVRFLMEYLATRQDPSINGAVGALLSNVLNKYFEEHAITEKDDKKNDKKNENENKFPEIEEVKHIEAAMESLLGKLAAQIQTSSPGLSHPEALYVAACLSMNSKKTIVELANSGLGITADLFDLFKDPDRLVRGCLRLLKSEVPAKPNKNQTAFLDSVKRWVFVKLDTIPGGAVGCYQYLVDVYGSVKPDLSPYYVQIKDCGAATYPNLIQAAKQIANK